jgi:beta-lactamase regulating signal transducer with metallopeptidase domain
MSSTYVLSRARGTTRSRVWWLCVLLCGLVAFAPRWEAAQPSRDRVHSGAAVARATVRTVALFTDENAAPSRVATDVPASSVGEGMSNGRRIWTAAALVLLAAAIVWVVHVTDD